MLNKISQVAAAAFQQHPCKPGERAGGRAGDVGAGGVQEGVVGERVLSVGCGSMEELMLLLRVGGCWENWSWEFGRSSPKDMVASSWTDSESLIRLMVVGLCVVSAEEVVRIWRLRRRASSCRIWKSFC